MTVVLPEQPLAQACHPQRVAVLAYDGVDELDLFGAYSVLAKARSAGSLQALGIFAPEPIVAASGGTEFRARGLASIDKRTGTVVVPGGRGATVAARDPRLQNVVRRMRSNGARIYCCCSGAILVAVALGLKEGRIAIHSRKKAELQTLFGGDVVAGMAENDGIVSIGGRRTGNVKSVSLAFRILQDLDPSLPPAISERTEIDWVPS